MIRLDQVEALLTRLYDRIDRQDLVIEDLQRQCAFYAIQAATIQRHNELMDALNATNARLDAVQVAAMARLGSDRV